MGQFKDLLEAIARELSAARRLPIRTLALALVSLGNSTALANTVDNSENLAVASVAQATAPSLTGAAEEQSRAPYRRLQVLERPVAPVPAAVAARIVSDTAGRPVFFSRSKFSGTSSVVTSSLHRPPAPAILPVARLASPASLAPARPAAVPSGLPVAATAFTSGFGMRAHPLLGGLRAHSGIDLAARSGSPIVATSDGAVSMAGWYGGYGLFVALEHGGGMQTRYGHMSRLNVAAGQQVRRGEVIGFVGSTGLSTGPHLHYEIRVNGQAVNPVTTLGR